MACVAPPVPPHPWRARRDAADAADAAQGKADELVRAQARLRATRDDLAASAFEVQRLKRLLDSMVLRSALDQSEDDCRRLAGENKRLNRLLEGSVPRAQLQTAEDRARAADGDVQRLRALVEGSAPRVELDVEREKVARLTRQMEHMGSSSHPTCTQRVHASHWSISSGIAAASASGSTYSRSHSGQYSSEWQRRVHAGQRPTSSCGSASLSPRRATSSGVTGVAVHLQPSAFSVRWQPAHATLVLARRPWLRRPVVRLLGRWPALFRVVRATVLEGPGV